MLLGALLGTRWQGAGAVNSADFLKKLINQHPLGSTGQYPVGLRQFFQTNPPND